MKTTLKHVGLLLAASGLAGSALVSCGSDAPVAIAKRITARNELIGGPGALGEVGDFLLANDQIRVIVQGEGYSRGFGVYGGAIIDADLQRPSSGDATGGSGYDQFAEMFPAFFLKAMAPQEGGIRVETSTDGAASVVVSGRGGDFLFMLTRINDVVAGGDSIAFENEYKVRPGKRYVEITTSVINISDAAISLPGEGVRGLIGDDIDFALPAGDVLLFGARNKVFTPIAGFDLRFTLQDLYKEATGLPQLPGLVTPFIATRGEHVSYGFASGVTDPNISFVSRAGYEGARPDDLLVPFIFSAFTGSFYAAAPKSLASRERFSFKKYFIVGSGDVASIRDVVHDIRKTATGELGGRVRDEVGKTPLSDVSVVTFDSQGRPYNQHTPDSNGIFRGTYEPGKYSYRVVSEGRFTTAPVDFEITLGTKTGIDIELPLAGFVSARVLGPENRPMPAKCTLVGRYASGAAGFDPMRFLYDLKVGEHMLATDLIPDVAGDPSTLEYIEKVIYLGAGPKTEPVRPGKYRAVCSRGIEYELATREIEVQSGRTATIDVMLEHSTKTPGWASGDYHLHSTNSIDSSMELDDRVVSIAAEGVDIAMASDHNFITDYSPIIAREGLERYVQGMVGLELTTLEIGHFNGFPLKYDPGPITKGAFEWSGRPPTVLFSDLRKRGAHGEDATIVQVNHPRDSILGYFNAFNWNQDTAEPEDSPNLLLAPEGPEFGPQNFDYGFDAMEIYNGKHFELLRSYRVPAVLPEPPLPAMIPPAGTLLRDESGRIAFPGGMDDWFVLLDQGRRYTAMGNSDSHGGEDEAGYPRTYTPVSDDLPGEIDELDIVRSIKAQKAVATNGPLIEVTVDGKGMGELATVAGGTAKLVVITRAASWIDLSTINVIVNGETVETIRGDRTALARVERDLPISRDSWVIVEVAGDKSMWPVVTPLEIPSIQVSDAVGSIASSFGIDFNAFGNLRPEPRGIVRPYGFTNPVWIDADGDGQFQGPGASRRSLRAIDPSTPLLPVKKLPHSKIPTLVKLFSAFSGH